MCSSTTWNFPQTFPQRRNATTWTSSSSMRGLSTSSIAPTSPTTLPWCIWWNLSLWQSRSARSACPGLGMWRLSGHPSLWLAGEAKKVETDHTFLTSCQWNAVVNSISCDRTCSQLLMWWERMCLLESMCETIMAQTFYFFFPKVKTFWKRLRSWIRQPFPSWPSRCAVNQPTGGTPSGLPWSLLAISPQTSFSPPT